MGLFASEELLFTQNDIMEWSRRWKDKLKGGGKNKEGGGNPPPS